MDFKQSRSLAERKVMLIYQSRPIRDLLTPIFKQIGAETVSAGPSVEMLRQLELLKPDIIFCEFEMDTLDGPTVVAQLRREHKLKTPIILVVDAQDGDARQKSRQCGANESLSMPFSVHDVITVTQKALDRPEAHVLRFGPRPTPEKK
ncbi:MAG TPA: response regulator [Rhodospirillaceae bacterium]|nr:response regulator [Rhodospirillaceae bacterium]